jgi:single-stranded DNA-specific DHH superfamily exonuclease
VLIQQREVTENPLLEGLDPLLRRVYASRDIRVPEQLLLDISVLLPPQSLKGIGQAVDLLYSMLKSQGRILIVSDFDADGATSCALAIRALSGMGFLHVDYIVPDRFAYGYGLSPAIVAMASERAPDLIITVDNGISSHEGVKAAHEFGIKVLITDHHLPGAHLPEADAIVNPNQPDCQFASKALAGVGVVFYLMLALRAQLRLVAFERGQAFFLHRRAALFWIDRRCHANVSQKSGGDLLLDAGLVGFPAKTSEHGFFVDVVAHIVRATVEAHRLLLFGQLQDVFFADRFQIAHAQDGLGVSDRHHDAVGKRAEIHVLDTHTGAA